MTKIGTVETKKISTIYLKFGEKIKFDQIRFFTTSRIFKHCLMSFTRRGGDQAPSGELEGEGARGRKRRRLVGPWRCLLTR
jgi:hypothetical protein